MAARKDQICGQDPHVAQLGSHTSPLSGALHRSLENLLVGPGGGGSHLDSRVGLLEGLLAPSILS